MLAFTRLSISIPQKKKSKSEQGMDYSLNQERFNQRRANDQTGVKFQTKL